MEDGFVNWRTGESIAGHKYPGLILPLEFGRDYHDREYLQNGKPQSAKLLMKRGDDGQQEFYAHIAFEFAPEPIKTETILGIDRETAKIGAASVIDMAGKLIVNRLDLEGAAFAVEMARLTKRTAEVQRTGHQRGRVFRLRGRKADSIIGEYANRLVSEALKYRSQIALQRADSTSTARFLTQNQSRKLQDALTYKAERVGLPPPFEVPAAYAFQTCSKCGNKTPENRPKHDTEGKTIQGVFRCVSCGFEANADDNASEVVALPRRTSDYLALVIRFSHSCMPG
jgi:transposase